MARRECPNAQNGGRIAHSESPNAENGGRIAHSESPNAQNGGRIAFPESPDTFSGGLSTKTSGNTQSEILAEHPRGFYAGGKT